MNLIRYSGLGHSAMLRTLFLTGSLKLTVCEMSTFTIRKKQV